MRSPGRAGTPVSPSIIRATLAFTNSTIRGVRYGGGCIWTTGRPAAGLSETCSQGTAFLVAEDDSVGPVEEFLRVSLEVFGCRIEDHQIEIGLDEFQDAV